MEWPATRPHLTPREIEVLTLAARGYTNKAIARELGIALQTVKNLFTRSFRRIGARSRTEAVARAVAAGLITVEKAA